MNKPMILNPLILAFSLMEKGFLLLHPQCDFADSHSGDTNSFLFIKAFTELVRLQQAPEVKDAGLVWHRLIIQLYPGEPAHGLHVIERFLHARIGQPYHCCRQYTRNIIASGRGGRPLPAFG